MMKLKKIVLALVLCVVAALGLTACGGAHTYTLNYANLKLSAGQEMQLAVTSEPEGEFAVTYESSDPEVATVSETGMVKAVADGTAAITAKVDDVTLTCNVTVETAQYVYSLKYGAAILGVGAELKLEPSVLPAKDFSVSYATSDANVATVAADGTVKGVAAGKAVITADVGETKLTCAVSVSESAKQYAYALSDAALDLYETAEAKLDFTVSPDKETAVRFTSSDPAIAAVDEKGNVTAVAAGEAEIYAEADGQRFVCRVRVRAMYVLNYKSAEVTVGEKVQLSLVNAIDESIATSVTFTSDAQDVATVSESGEVTAVKAGVAVITAELGGRKTECIVTVLAE